MLVRFDLHFASPVLTVDFFHPFATPLLLLVSASGPSSLSGVNVGGVASMSGVIYSDDDSDLSVSDIDEGVIASESVIKYIFKLMAVT